MNLAALTADNSQYRKSNMMVDKPEVLIIQQCDEIIEKFQRLGRNLKRSSVKPHELYISWRMCILFSWTYYNSKGSQEIRVIQRKIQYFRFGVGNLELEVSRNMAGDRK
jgi:hypothetical protein